jgi:hypothetical protein
MQDDRGRLTYALWLLTARIGQWAPWKVAPFGALMVAGTAWLWYRDAGSAAAWGQGLALAAFSGADAALFWGLLRHGLSYGPPLPPWLGMLVLRCGVALAMLLPGWSPLLALAVTLGIQALAWGLMAYGTLLEPFRIQVSHVSVASPKLANPGMPLRVVHLSDLHLERWTQRERDVLARVAELQPDLIVLTGDYLSTSYNEDPRALAELRSFLAQLKAPWGVYAIWGTPEVDFPAVLRPTFDSLEIVLMEDQAVEVKAGEHRLWLIGLRCRGDHVEGGAMLRRLLGGAPPGAFTLLLHHSPDLMPQARDAGVDLMLAGHTHGGQWRLPGFGAVHTGSRYWKRYESGYRNEGGTHLYVSRGLGMEGYGAPRARFFCRPEVVCLTLGAP